MGTIVISVDAELAWGSHDFETVPTDRVESSRDGWKLLLDQFDRYELPATWAVVGHLFLRECDGVHADHPSLDGWFDADPGGTASENPEWFDHGLVDAVLEANVEHDVGGHSFSHRQLNPDLPPEIARAEVAATVEAAEARGLELKSFVHPGNVVAHEHLLAEYGFTCYRGRAPDVGADGAVGAVQKLLGGAGVEPRLVDPEIDEYGLVNVPASLYLFELDGAPKRVLGSLGRDPVVHRARRGIEAAAERDGLFHLWLHPNNLVGDVDESRLEEVFSYVDEVRSNTDLTVETMADVADRVLKKEASRPA